MNSNIIALKTQETEQDFSAIIEPKITQKMAEVGVEITKSITFTSATHLQKSMFYLLEACSIVFVSFSCDGFDSILGEINKFYAVQSKDFNCGKYWHDEANNRFCLLFNIENTNFIHKIDDKFLKSLFAPTKYQTVIKTFGISDFEIKKALAKIEKPNEFEYFITSNYLDCQINILCPGDFYNSKQLNNYVQTIYQLLEKYVYSDKPLSLYDCLQEILDIRNIKISFCDFFTAGKFQYILKNNLKSYAKNVAEFVEIFDNSELIKKINFKQEILEKPGLKQDELIYETAVCLLGHKKSDISVVLFKDRKSVV